MRCFISFISNFSSSLSTVPLKHMLKLCRFSVYWLLLTSVNSAVLYSVDILVVYDENNNYIFLDCFVAHRERLGKNASETTEVPKDR